MHGCRATPREFKGDGQAEIIRIIGHRYISHFIRKTHTKTRHVPVLIGIRLLYLRLLVILTAHSLRFRDRTAERNHPPSRATDRSEVGGGRRACDVTAHPPLLTLYHNKHFGKTLSFFLMMVYFQEIIQKWKHQYIFRLLINTVNIHL